MVILKDPAGPNEGPRLAMVPGGLALMSLESLGMAFFKFKNALICQIELCYFVGHIPPSRLIQDTG